MTIICYKESGTSTFCDVTQGTRWKRIYINILDNLTSSCIYFVYCVAGKIVKRRRPIGHRRLRPTFVQPAWGIWDEVLHVAWSNQSELFKIKKWSSWSLCVNPKYSCCSVERCSQMILLTHRLEIFLHVSSAFVTHARLIGFSLAKNCKFASDKWYSVNSR